jgi:hypothetical protein
LPNVRNQGIAFRISGESRHLTCGYIALTSDATYHIDREERIPVQLGGEHVFPLFEEHHMSKSAESKSLFNHTVGGHEAQDPAFAPLAVAGSN